LDIFDIVLIAFGLAMDAFSVSLAASGTGRINNRRAIFRLSFHFGFFQFIMPVLGWFVGKNLMQVIAIYDHWLAFIILQIVAFHMLMSCQKSSELKGEYDPSKGYNLIILSLATSIDALAVGFSLAMIKINIWYPSFIVGLITASMAFLGIVIGNYVSQRLGKTSAIVGGIILSGIGFRILFSHI
jgi:putative Mn2+ efflux pump MntP